MYGVKLVLSKRKNRNFTTFKNRASVYILNTSFMVEYEAHGPWLHHFRETFIPALLEAGFEKPIFTKVMADEMEGHFTYSLQVPMKDLERYKEFTEEMMPEYARQVSPVFGTQVLWFSSLLKKVDF